MPIDWLVGANVMPHSNETIANRGTQIKQIKHERVMPAVASEFRAEYQPSIAPYEFIRAVAPADCVLRV